MASIKQQIVNKLSTDLLKIQTVNGYLSDVKEVIYGQTFLNNVTNWVSVYFGVKDPESNVQEYQNSEFWELQIVVGAHIKGTESTIQILCDNILYDFDRHFSSDDSILQIYRTEIGLVDGVTKVTFPQIYNWVDATTDSRTVEFIVKVKYLKDRKNIARSGTTITIPNVLDNYALTAITDYLQSEIDALTGSVGNIAFNNITYSSLTGKIASKSLSAGNFYKITDYQTIHVIPTTTALNIGIVEPLICFALSGNLISNQVYSLLYPNDYIEYDWTKNTEALVDHFNVFDQPVYSGLSASKPGFITKRIDSNGNETPYDSRNVKFYRNGSSVPTFGTNCKNNIIKGCNYPPYYNLNDNVFGNTCVNNKIDYDCASNTFGNGCQANIFGTACFYNTLGNYSNQNTFGNYCGSNTLSGSGKNTFGEYCNGNVLGMGSESNIFGTNCDNNNLGTSCMGNTFGTGASTNTLESIASYNMLGNNFKYNVLGNDSHNNVFHDSNWNNTFGTSCYNNTFGVANIHNNFGNNFADNHIGNWMQYNTFAGSCSQNDFGNYTVSGNFPVDVHSNKFVSGIHFDVVDLSSATHIKQWWYKKIFYDNAYNIKISFYDSDGAENIVGVTE